MPRYRHVSRRMFLALGAVAAARLAAACSDAGAQPAAPTADAAAPEETPTPAAIATAAPEPAPTPEPLSLTLPEAAVPQGGSFAAIVRGAGVTGVQATFAGRTYTGVADGGGWLVLIGAGQRVGDTAQHAPGAYPVRALLALEGGEPRTLAGTVTVEATRFPVEEITLGPAETALLDPGLTERELARLRPVYAGFTPRRLWEGFFLRPAGGPITDVFGSRRSYNGGPAVGSHSGVDFGADAGAPIRAAASGQVVLAERLPVRGNGTVIDHGAGVFTGYFHQSAIGVAMGQEVRAGEQIGLVGATGLVTGPHLHWEVVIAGYQVNGLLWLQDQS